jgi:hypothetical protein
MTIASIIVAVIIVAAILYWLVRAERKEATRLNDLRIVPGDEDQR